MSDIILDSHKPALDAGTYELVFSQTLKDGVNVLNTGDQKLKFIIEGEKYALDQQQIDSVFPPAGSMGDFSLVLPHIILNRSTLPWERKAKNDDEKNTPWLALLLFTEDEMSSTEEITDGKLFCVKHIPINVWDTKSKKNDLISIIMYDSIDHIKDILPEFNELPYLAHVRATDGEEKAVVVCNRLPKIDRKNIVHLVSLEDCFDTNGLKLKKDSKGNTAIVSLKSWEFFCNDHFIVTPEVIEVSSFDEDLKSILKTIQNTEYFSDKDFIGRINDEIKNAKSKYKISIKTEDDLCKAFRIGHLPDILKHLNRTPATLRLPNAEKDNLNITFENIEKPSSSKKKYVAMKEVVDFADQIKLYGYINLPFTLRTGKEIDALYRGPMTPSEQNSTPGPVTLMHSDEAFRYFKDANKLDVSYASAWELGKLLAIQNKNFSVALYKWKRECYQSEKQSGTSDTVIYPDPPQLVKDWFVNLKNLKGIPYNYLIPDPSFIPFESIRFFYVDELWLKHMIDGAFSIGRISDLEKSYDEKIYSDTNFGFLKTLNIRSGFLLHSLAVAGWPDLVIFNNQGGGPPGYTKCADDGGSFTFNDPVDIAYGADGVFGYKEGVSGIVNFVDNLRVSGYYKFCKNLLSPNLLISIFLNPMDSVSIHQKPGSIHFGFEDYNYPNLEYDSNINVDYTPVPNSMDDDEQAKKIDINKLANDLLNKINNGSVPDGDVAKFANKLIQKLEVITFNCK